MRQSSVMRWLWRKCFFWLDFQSRLPRKYQELLPPIRSVMGIEMANSLFSFCFEFFLWRRG